MLLKIFFTGILNWLPLIVAGVFVLIIIVNNLLSNRKYLLFLKKIKTINLAYILIGLTVLFNIFLSVLQYFVWRNDSFGHFFLPPFQPLSYFLGYVSMHFWFASFLTFSFSLVFFLFFKVIKKCCDGIASDDEISLILLTSLLLGWPNFIIFVPLFLLLTLIFSLINLLIFKNKKNSLTLPLIFSLIIVFLLGHYLINLLSLSAFII